MDAGAFPASAGTKAQAAHPAYQAYQILRFGFTILPLAAGIDKFTHYLANWDQYLSPAFARLGSMVGLSPHNFMLAVGVIEIIAGALCAAKPRFGGYVVMAWLWGIVLNLILLHGYYDIALRDLGLSLGALALSRLGEAYHRA
jgi:hypothetical protein